LHRNAASADAGKARRIGITGAFARSAFMPPRAPVQLPFIRRSACGHSLVTGGGAAANVTLVLRNPKIE